MGLAAMFLAGLNTLRHLVKSDFRSHSVRDRHGDLRLKDEPHLSVN